MKIALSILEYELDLCEQVDNVEESEAFSSILRLIGTGKIHRVHIDVMRPPMISDRNKFPVKLICRLYGVLRKKIALVAHLMVQEPFPIVDGMNEFIAKEHRAGMTLIIQRESFRSEEETVEALDILKEQGYKVGICLNLPTPCEDLTEKIVENADTVLLMTVPMGKGGQKYGKDATERIAHFSREHPNKTIEVDGGITPQTIVEAMRAGADVAVVGSFITRNEDPEGAVLSLKRSIELELQSIAGGEDLSSHDQ
jgi:pentose-5-phosphate-3-epimerase